MATVAIYNLKGGVGKTTTAVNLAYLAAAEGQRTLLWDLDPQAAATFAFRVRPHVPGFGTRRFEGGTELGAAIKETDYNNLDLLPAAFAYRKFDKWLHRLGKPTQVLSALLVTLGREYDAVFLDCPAGFSALTEGLFAASDIVIAPTLPNVLSFRTLARLVTWAQHSESPCELVAFFNMVDRRKILHRRASEWSLAHPEIFLSQQVPYASVVEQVGVRRMPLAVLAARDPATTAFAGLSAELRSRLQLRGGEEGRARDRWMPLLQTVEALIKQSELEDDHTVELSGQGAVAPMLDSRSCSGQHNVDFVHKFDTEGRTLAECGYLLELREHAGSFVVVAAQSGSHHDFADPSRCARARIDRAWAAEILSGVMSPIAALDQRTGRSGPDPSLARKLRGMVGARKLVRIESRAAEQVTTDALTPTTERDNRRYTHASAGVS